jgi:hypothetical protein
LTKPASVAGSVVLGIRVSNWVFKIMGYKNSDSTKAFTFSEIPLPLMWKPIAENVFCIEYSANDITSFKSIGYGGDDESELFLSLGQLLQNAPSCLLRDVQEYGNDTSTYRDGHPASTLFLSCFLALDCMCLSMPYKTGALPFSSITWKKNPCR